MIDLAQYSEQELSPSAALHSDRRFQRAIWSSCVAKLKKAGLVISIRGAAGGYRLATDLRQIFRSEMSCAHWKADVRAVICTAQTEEGCEGEEHLRDQICLAAHQ